MILIFDLDDTLYDERTYVESGLHAVATFARRRFGWDTQASFEFMIDCLDRDGRGAIFDKWLQSHNQFSKTLVSQCVRLYRNHEPNIALNEHAKRLLPLLRQDHQLYLVTDGHKVAQTRKVEALRIRPYFERVLITHNFGIKNAKPSPYCFERIRTFESCSWSEMVYIGDNPAKDFVAMNQRGAHTVRVLTGGHRNAVAAPGFEAQHTLESLGELEELLPTIIGESSP